MEFIISGEAIMEQFGRQLADLLKGGMVVELIGDVGAGKTTLTRAIARQLGVKGPVQSPTFTISNRYDLPDGRILAHYDFYRLGEAGIMRDELDEAIHDQQTITIIEWGDIIADILPSDRITLQIVSPTETERKITATGRGDYEHIMEDIKL